MEAFKEQLLEFVEEQNKPFNVKFIVEEGTVTKNEIRGKVVDITPKMFKQHKVYRYGISFSLPCKLEMNK